MPRKFTYAYTRQEQAQRRELLAKLKTETDPDTREALAQRLQDLRDASRDRAKQRAAQIVSLYKVESFVVDGLDLMPPTRLETDSDDVWWEKTEFYQLNVREAACRKVLNDPRSNMRNQLRAQKELRKIELERHVVEKMKTQREAEEAEATERERLAALKPPPRSPSEQSAMEQFLVSLTETPKPPENSAAKAEPKVEVASEAEPKRSRTLTTPQIESRKHWKNQHGSWRDYPDDDLVMLPKPQPVPPPKPNRHVAYRIVADDLLVWPDGTPCELPLPRGVRVSAISTPWGYVSGSGRVPEGMVIDEILFAWRRI